MLQSKKTSPEYSTRNKVKGISKSLPYPLLWRGIKGEVKTKTQVFRDALKLIHANYPYRLLPADFLL